jgi:hypothetical protein
MKRLDCLSLLAPLIKDDDLVVTTLGWVAGEWFAVRHKESNLYQVNMGMCTPLCLGWRWCCRIAVWSPSNPTAACF